MKQIIHFGVYDEYTELEYGQYTALASNSFEVIQEDLQAHLGAQIVRIKENLQFDWAQPELDHTQGILTTVNNAKTVEDFENNGNIHYVVIDLVGDFDGNTTNLD